MVQACLISSWHGIIIIRVYIPATFWTLRSSLKSEWLFSFQFIENLFYSYMIYLTNNIKTAGVGYLNEV